MKKSWMSEDKVALELAPRIRVNCLVPGSIKTREVIERYRLEPGEELTQEIGRIPLWILILTMIATEKPV